MTQKINWNEDNTNALIAAVEGVDVVSQEQLGELAEQLGTTKRSVGSKLRKMGFEVQKATEVAKSRWEPSVEAELVDFIEANAGVFTYAEIASQFRGGEYTPKQVQGKILSLERTELVKATEKSAAPRTYSPEQEAQFIDLANAGNSLESIAEALAKPLQSVRGKALSLLLAEQIEAIPHQETTSAKSRQDVLEGLDVANMTVEEIAAATDKTDRGIKSMLSRRGITCADYDGAAKREKLDKAAEA